MPGRSTSRRAAIYLRISSDPEGRRLGVDRQVVDCRALCDDYGYEVVEVFTENDTSASTRSQRERPEYMRMIAAARAGTFDVLVAYSTSRLTRRPIEWEELIQLHDRHSTAIHLVKRGLLDLAKASVKRDLRTDSTSDAYYAEEIAELVTNASRHRAMAGEWHGGQVPFGFVRAGAPGQPGKLEHHPERAELIRDIARRILNGQTLYAVCTTMNQQGIRTAPSSLARDGSRWHAKHLKRILTSPITGGMREYRGELFDGQWDAILDRATWERLRVILNDPDRATRHSWLPRHKYALSGLVVCGRSSCVDGRRTLTSNVARGRQSFLCSPTNGGCGKIRVNLDVLEDFVVRQMLALLDVPAVREALSRGDESGDDGELRQVIQDDERRLQRLEDEHYDDVIDRDTYLRQRDRISDRLRKNRADLAALQRSAFIVDLGGRTVHDAWAEHANDLGWRRTLLQYAINRVVVHPHPTKPDGSLMASTLTRFRGEPDDALAQRRLDYSRELMARRVVIEWRTEELPTGDSFPMDEASFEHLTPIERHALWVSRMRANRPVQLTDPAAIADVGGLMHGRSE